MSKLKLTPCILLLAPIVAVADSIVVPNAQTSSPGNETAGVPSSPTPGIYQELFAAGQFPGSIDITGLAFRASPGTGSVDWMFSSLNVYLSTSSKATNGTGSDLMSTTLADNIGVDNTLVFSGTNVTLSDAGCSGPGACPSDLNTAFTTPFKYDPANGNLLVEYVFTGFFASGAGLVDQEGFRSPGGSVAQVTDFGSSTATTGTFSYGGLVTQFTSTPEPASWIMMAGAAGLLWALRRRQQSSCDSRPN
jgi:PEP-CTERM motif